MLIRKLKQEDAQTLSEMIVITLRTTNAKDYSEAYLEDLIRRMQPDSLLESAAGRHFYVVEEDGRIVGSGAVGPYHSKKDESCLYTVFVHPDFQGKGVGRRIMATLERDDYFRRAKRVEVPASLTAVRFYLKLGYTYKNGVTEPDVEQLIRLEKRR